MLANPHDALIFGPAYLDRVIRVDRPLLDPSLGLPALDRSVDGRWLDHRGDSIRLIDPGGATLTIEPAPGWPGPVGTVAISRAWAGGIGAGRTMGQARGVGWSEDLGGMGAGFAASLGGTLISALGPDDDPDSRAVLAGLDRAGIAHEPVRIAGRVADWTLLISSGEHGDKLPIGFRGCHAAWDDVSSWVDRRSRVRVVAALPNRLALAVLGSGGPGTIRAFFPNARNMLDRVDPAAQLAGMVDVLSCNAGEWIDLGDQALAFAGVAILAVTDGPRGATVRYRADDGSTKRVEVAAFPRSTPIVDTNRAGEAFAATLLATLLDAGWAPGPVASGLVERAAVRASAAAALVLGRGDFGFATDSEVDAAVRRGRA